MGRHGGLADPPPPGGMTEQLNSLLHPPTTGPAPIRDLSSVLFESTRHFQIDIDQVPKAIAAFRQAAEGLRDLMDDAERLSSIRPPGLDAVSINAAKEIGRWAISEEPGSLRWAVASGAVQLEKTADALERSLATYHDTDSTNAEQLSRQDL